MRLPRIAAVLWICAWLTLACNPALNWRAVQLAGIKVMLPCKPDRAQRILPLANQQVTMAMAGCEASGALYAISHVQVANTALVAVVQADWQQAMLANFQGASIQKIPYQLERPSITARLAASSPSDPVRPGGLEILNVQGKGTDGAPLQARLLWLAQGTDLYHVAIYGPALQADQFDMLYSGLALQ